MSLKQNSVVIVLDIGNYKSEYQEQVPFKAELYKITDYPCYWVRSLTTGKEYEVYASSILELLDEKEIKSLIDMKKYGA